MYVPVIVDRVTVTIEYRESTAHVLQIKSMHNSAVSTRIPNLSSQKATKLESREPEEHDNQLKSQDSNH